MINEIVEQISISPEETSLIADVLRENYNNAEEFGLFKNDESLEALEGMGPLPVKPLQIILQKEIHLSFGKLENLMILNLN